MRVSSRLLLAFLAVIVVLVIPTGYAMLRLGELQTLAVGGRDRQATAALAMGRIEAGLSRVDLQIRSYLVAPGPAEAAELDSTMENLRSQMAVLEAAGYGEGARTARSMVEALGAAIVQVEALVREGRLQEATESFGPVQALIERADRALTDVSETVDRRAQADFRRAHEISSSARAGTLFALIVVLAIGGAVGLWATGRLASPLRNLSRATSEVADGDFDAPTDLPYERRDEIGDLSRSFRTMTRRLDELDRMKAEFVGLATHDLKTPINVIMGYAELVEEEVAEELTPRQHEILQGISEQCRVLTRLVSRLMDISRLEAGTYRLQMERVHVEDLVTGTVRAFDLLAERQGVRLSTRIEESAPSTIVVDVDVVRQEILGNLISNAIKFTPEGGEVRITVRGSGDKLVFRVSDTGPGIPPDHHEHVFQKYYQVDRSRRMGAGLGLAIVRELTSTHGGRVELIPEPEPGLGAVFDVYLSTEAEDREDVRASRELVTTAPVGAD